MDVLSFLDGRLGKFDDWYFRYHRFSTRRDPKMFHRGWGSDAAIQAIHDRWASGQPARDIDIRWTSDGVTSLRGIRERTGTFETPVHREHLPPESRLASVTFVEPAAADGCPVVVLMPTSREAGVAKRMRLARSLAAGGIGAMLLDSPFMGARKPADQSDATLRYFSDFLLLSATSVEEGRSVLDWLGRGGHRRLCCAGISQGGYLATVAGLRSTYDAHVVAMLAPDSGTAVLLEGLIGRLCDWDVLQATSPRALPVRQRMAELFQRTNLADLQERPNARLTLIAAERDGYVRAAAYRRLQAAWKGRATVHWLAGGHVSSILEKRHLGDAIRRSFAAGPR